MSLNVTTAKHFSLKKLKTLTGNCSWSQMDTSIVILDINYTVMNVKIDTLLKKRDTH